MADVFPEFPAPRNVVRSMSTKLSNTGPFARKHRKWVEKLSQYHR